MTIKLSKASKMPCKSWSLQAIDTCPGSIGPDGKLVPACQGCYATTGNYRFPNVKAPREHNRKDWKRDDWVADMVEAIGNDYHFRWFDSGDVYSLALARKILAVMEDTPNTRHWLPTRMHKFPKFREVFAAMESLENVVVRYSSDGINGEIIKGRNTSTIIPDAGLETWLPSVNNATLCEAYKREGKCGDCRACWRQDVQVVAYPQHGQKMARVNRELNLALAS